MDAVDDTIVVILAAGQGTRMRSRTPKLLHPLCGRPLIDWPLAAARAAGAARIVVVDSPSRPLAAHLTDDVEVVIQEAPRGTGDAVASAAAAIDPDGDRGRARRGCAADRRRDAAGARSVSISGRDPPRRC